MIDLQSTDLNELIYVLMESLSYRLPSRCISPRDCLRDSAPELPSRYRRRLSTSPYLGMSFRVDLHIQSTIATPRMLCQQFKIARIDSIVTCTVQNSKCRPSKSPPQTVTATNNPRACLSTINLSRHLEGQLFRLIQRMPRHLYYPFLSQ